jgi:hypothetical protein
LVRSLNSTKLFYSDGNSDNRYIPFSLNRDTVYVMGDRIVFSRLCYRDAIAPTLGMAVFLVAPDAERR